MSENNIFRSHVRKIRLFIDNKLNSNKSSQGLALLNLKSTSLIFLITFIITLPFILTQDTIAQQPFEIDKVETWTTGDITENWNKIKEDPNSASRAWQDANSEIKNKFIDNLINKDRADKITLGDISSKDLGFLEYEKSTVLTNGKTFIDPEKLPPGLKELSYDDENDAFVYTFKEQKDGKTKEDVMVLRDGTLAEVETSSGKKLKVTGTGWPSDGLEWNKRGSFTQTREKVTLKGDARVEVGIADVGVNDKTKEASVEFFPGELGEKYFRGDNMDVNVKGDMYKVEGLTSITMPDGQVKFITSDTPNSYIDSWLKTGGKGNFETLSYFSKDPKSQFYLSDNEKTLLLNRGAKIEALSDFKFANVKTPFGKTTEILLGEVDPATRTENFRKFDTQYVEFSSSTGQKTFLDSIRINGEDITTEMFTPLNKVEVDGNNVLVKNGENFYQFVTENINNKPVHKTYANHKPGEGNSVEIINDRNPNGNVKITNEPVEPAFSPGGEPGKIVDDNRNEFVKPPITVTPTKKPTTSEGTSTNSENSRVINWVKKGEYKGTATRFLITVETGRTTFYLDESDWGNFRNLPDQNPRIMSSVTSRNLDLVDVKNTLNERISGDFGFSQQEQSALLGVMDDFNQGLNSKGIYSIPQGYTLRMHSSGKTSGNAKIELWNGNNLIQGKSLTGNNAESIIRYVNDFYKQYYLKDATGLP